uniref:Reverse transcriptase domain-containing protein n=1 Tax=Tanacetum cinerariifolium TaxID=118510 RepID=A0A6L2NNX1_TANCI|nr:hypothetical protein [Tanacetum cinerariifolium]
MSDASSTVTYTSVYTDSKPWRYYGEDSVEIGPPRVIVYGYDGLCMQPVAPPTPDYIPGPEHPPFPNYVPGPEHPPLPMEIPYVPEPEYPEYLALSDDEAPLKDQPLPADASPIAASLDNMADSDPKEDPEDNQADYPANGGDGDDEPSDDDDDDTDDEDLKEEPFEEDDEEKEEEHPASADSLIVPVVDLVLSARETEALEADEPTHPGPTESDLRRCRVEQAGYRITNEWDEIVDKMMKMAPTTLEWVKERVTKLDTTVRQRMDEFVVRFKDAQFDRAPLRARVNTLYIDRPYHSRTSMLMDRDVMYSHEAYAFSMDRSSAIVVHVGTLETQVAALITQTRSLQIQLATGLGRIENVMRTRAEMVIIVIIQEQAGEGKWLLHAYTDFFKCQPMSFQGTEGVVGLTRWLEKMESVFQISNCTVACQVERYIGGLPDMIHGSVKASKPQWMPKAIKFATKMMDKKMLTHAKHQAEHKRKFDDTSRDTQHQQSPFKRNNVARAYTTRQGDKKPYGGTKPLFPKCNYHYDGPCAPKCTNRKKIGHVARDCKSRPAANNNNNQSAQRANGKGNTVARAYVVGNAGTNPNSNVATVMSSSPHSTIVPSASDIENTFSSTNILNYFSASPGSFSPDSSNDFTKYLLDILVFFPLHDDSKIEVIQAYDTIPPPQVVIAKPSILPPSPILSVSPMFDSQDLFPSKEISRKETKTHVESPILAPPSSSEGSS